MSASISTLSRVTHVDWRALLTASVPAGTHGGATEHLACAGMLDESACHYLPHMSLRCQGAESARREMVAVSWHMRRASVHALGSFPKVSHGLKIASHMHVAHSGCFA